MEAGVEKKTAISPKSKKRPRRKREVPPTEVGDIEDISFSKDEALQIRASLLEWYDKNQRDLPWRTMSGGLDERDKRGYAVWVSEVMLQQTRVSTVIDYFKRWMNKWPTLHHLAQASLEEVNEMWAGLGYYRRVRFLLQGAKEVVEGGGRFPETVSDLRKIKGIGEYTAGAIASIAFRKAVPVVDGNVVRVISRLKTISGNPKDAATVKSFWKLAGQLVDPCRPGDFNQALMELGATLCSLSNPGCAACPISAQCHVLSLSGENELVHVTDYPTKVVKAKQRHEFSAVSVVEILNCQETMGPQSSSKYILVKRPNKGLLAGLWEFPSVLLEKEADLTSRRKAVDNYLQSSFNLDLKESTRIVSRENIGECVHVFSHIRLKMYVELLVLHAKGNRSIDYKKQGKESITWKYVDNENLGNMGLTSGVRKVYTMVQKHKQTEQTTIPGRRRKTAVRR
ncbi:A/G-specific adenine DNA glycosylase [Capsicum annuum]|nr:A/G-specific adenine DNA glycosylase [Capsicum annuum]